MNKPKLKASELIKPCCGTLIDVTTDQVVLMVQKLEHDNCVYFNALKGIQSLPSVREDESSDIASRAIKACE